jgi:hypothetical protein
LAVPGTTVVTLVEEPLGPTLAKMGLLSRLGGNWTSDAVGGGDVLPLADGPGLLVR